MELTASSIRSNSSAGRCFSWPAGTSACAAVPGASRAQPGDSHLLWTLRYYINGHGESAGGAPAGTLTKGGRLRELLAAVVTKGEAAQNTR